MNLDENSRCVQVADRLRYAEIYSLAALVQRCRGVASVDEAQHSDSRGTVVRFTFPDGTVLTVTRAMWDWGAHPDCFCFNGIGHTAECVLP